MKISKVLQVSPLFFVFALPVGAQGFADLEVINQTRLDYNLKGMLILGTWAVVNLILGALASFRTSGQT
jgi:hypothetical protein